MDVNETAPHNGHGEQPTGTASNLAVIHTQTQITPRPATQPVSRNNLMPVISVKEMIERRSYIAELVKQLLVEGVDYGAIPGGNKPVLLKPGAEKMISVFGLVPHLDSQTAEADWTGERHGGEAFFYYEYQFSLSRDGVTLGVGIGSANSWESKYRYRWVPESDIPPALRVNKAALPTRDSSEWVFKFALDKAETTGPYGKPPEYWQRFHDAIANGSAVMVNKATKNGREFPAIVIPAITYRIPNPDVADVVNTLQKMAQKRAYIQATLMATGLSEFFTQDMEDLIVDTAPVADPVVAPVDPAPNTKTTPAPAASGAGRAAAPPPKPPEPPTHAAPSKQEARPAPAPTPAKDAYGEIPQTAPRTADRTADPTPQPDNNKDGKGDDKAIGLAQYKAALVEIASKQGHSDAAIGAAINQYLRGYLGLAERGAMPKDQAIYVEPMTAIAVSLSADPSTCKQFMSNPAAYGRYLKNQVDQIANGQEDDQEASAPAAPSASTSEPPPMEATTGSLPEIRAYICQTKGFGEADLTALLNQHRMGGRDEEEQRAYLLLMAYTPMARLAASDKWSAVRVVQEVEKDLGERLVFPPDPTMRSAIEVSLTGLTTQPSSPLLR